MKLFFIFLLYANCLLANVDNAFKSVMVHPPVRHFHKNMLLGFPDDFQNTEKVFQYQQSMSTRSLIAQPFISLFSGVPAAFIFGVLTVGALENAEYTKSEDVWAGAIYSGLSGYMLGSAFACWHYGKHKTGQGSFEGTLMGSLVGGLLGLGASLASDNFAPFLIGPPIGATITFHLTRKP